MRFSKFLKVGVIVSVASILAWLPMVSAQAGAKTAVLTVSPSTVTESSSNNFQLTDTTGGGGGVKCMVFTLTDFTSLSSPAVVSPTTGWTATLGPNADQVTLQGSPAIGTGLSGSVTVDATAPAGTDTPVWTVDAYTDETGCSKLVNEASASTTVNVVPPPPPGNNDTTTTLTCDTGTPIVGVADSCTATVTDNGSPNAATNPTGTIDLSTSGGGAFADASCVIDAATNSGSNRASCDPVNYTASAPGSQTLTATYEGDTGIGGDHNGSVGTFGLTAQSKPAAGCRCLPDMLIRLAHHAKWRGEGVVNGTGAHQSIKVAAHVGQTWVVYLQAENDGTVRDHITVAGIGSRPFIKVAYFHGATNVTRQVTHNVYVQSIPAGGHTQLRMVVHLRTGVRAGVTRVFPVEGRSGINFARRDVVKFKLNIFKV